MDDDISKSERREIGSSGIVLVELSLVDSGIVLVELSFVVTCGVLVEDSAVIICFLLVGFVSSFFVIVREWVSIGGVVFGAALDFFFFFFFLEALSAVMDLVSSGGMSAFCCVKLSIDCVAPTLAVSLLSSVKKSYLLL